jgi:hypothetical protein
MSRRADKNGCRHAFLGENIHRIDFTSNVLDCNGFVLYLFANRIFVRLDVSCCLRCHVVRPLDTGVIVIVEESRFINVSDWKTRLCKAKTEIA